MFAKQFMRCESCGLVRRVEGAPVVCGERAWGVTCSGKLTIDERYCHAVLFHGPGHQSSGRCELPNDGHAVHRVEYGGCQVAYFLGPEAFTGFFDEPQELEDA
jgi:hypothetical protein